MSGLAGLLAEHRLYGGGDTGDDPECGCGVTPPEDWWEEDFGELLWHEEHVAQVVLALIKATLTDPAAVEAVAERIHGHMKAVRDRGDYMVGPASDEASSAALAAALTALGAS